jgi:nitrogen fixation/metabolism regulation signal transduction histidine kinase
VETKPNQMKYIVIVSIICGAFILYLLSNASPDTSASGAYYTLLVTLNICFAVLLIGLILWQVYGIYQKIRQRVVGIRFTLRLLISFALMALVPGLIVYLVSVNFITKSIESWFNVKVEAALAGGLNLGQTALDILLVGVQDNAENIANNLSLQPADLQNAMLNDLRDKSGIKDATLLTAQGRVLAVSSADSTSFIPELPSLKELQESRFRIVADIKSIDKKGLYLRVLAPVKTHDLSGEKRILQLLQPVPKPLANTAEAVQGVFQDYQKLLFTRASLRDVFALTLTLVMMFSMLVAVAIAFVLSKKMAEPLTVLSEGTKAIASGDYNIMLPEHTKDELGVLVKSFNSMTRQLNDATKVAELNRLRVDEARSYLATILAYLSSGVIALNGQGQLRTFNQAALSILDIDLGPYIGYELDYIIKKQPQLTSFLTNIFEKSQLADKAKATDEDQVQVEILGQKGKQVLTLRGTRLPDGGYVAVFDDATSMIQVQRDAAWGEVARRLAHEIKNPLTPIQLSAERMAHKLQGKLDERDENMLNRSISTIVNQVDAMKKMVNEFSEYARSPSPNISALDLNALILEVVSLYEVGNQHGMQNSIKVSLNQSPSTIMADSTMLRQVLHNLLQNALDAHDNPETLEILVKTELEKNNVILTVKDNGSGFPAEMLSHAFEPYMTTKSHGTGLGLAIVKKIVDEHKGIIKIENIVNHETMALQGAIIKMSFPSVSL